LKPVLGLLLITALVLQCTEDIRNPYIRREGVYNTTMAPQSEKWMVEQNRSLCPLRFCTWITECCQILCCQWPGTQHQVFDCILV